MKEIFNSLTLEEKIGQRFIFGTNTNNVEIIEQLIKNSYIGGVILYSRNYTTYDEMLKVIKRFKDANKNNKLPLFIAIDQEGGKVNRLTSEFHQLKNIYDVSKTDEKLIKDHAEVIGEILSKSGINMDFAPVLDIYNDSRSKAIYKRCFYGDENDVYRCSKVYTDKLISKNVVPVVKHFPGHGSSKFDSHSIVPHVFNYKEVLKVHMKPFENIIKDGIDAIMVGHLSIRGLTNGLPASISESFNRKYLREKNNYDGLIITDEINMLKRSPYYRLVYLRKALMSSNDIILVKIKTVEEGYKIIDKCKKLYNKENLDINVKRIINVKEKYKLNDENDYNGPDIDEINIMIDKINSKVEII